MLLSAVTKYLQEQINDVNANVNAKIWLNSITDITTKYSNLPGFITSFFKRQRIQQVLKLLETLEQEDGSPSI